MIRRDIGIIALLITLPIDRLVGVLYFIVCIVFFNVILKIKKWLFQT